MRNWYLKELFFGFAMKAATSRSHSNTQNLVVQILNFYYAFGESIQTKVEISISLQTKKLAKYDKNNKFMELAYLYQTGIIGTFISSLCLSNILIA